VTSIWLSKFPPARCIQIQTCFHKFGFFSSSFAISKSRIKKIEAWKSKHGGFKDLNEMLDLDSFGVKVLEKFCHSIVKDEKIAAPKSKSIKRVTAQSLSPAMTSSAGVDSCVSLFVAVNTVAWARFQLAKGQPTAVTDWNYFKLDDKKLTLADLVQMVLLLDKKIPAADVYVFETPLVAQQTAPNSPVQININVQKSQLIATLATILAKRGTESMDTSGGLEPQQTVFFLKHYLPSRLFRILVGSERVSNETVVSQLLRTHYNVKDSVEPKNNADLQRELDVPGELRNYYAKLGNPDSGDFNREYMGQALLIGLTFIRLCVLGCSDSLAIIENRKKS
jgi:transcription elongation factor, mitochondrial